MFWPNTISAADGAFRKSAIASRASATTASEACEVRKTPPRLALLSTRYVVIRSTTESGTWVPPGLSR